MLHHGTIYTDKYRLVFCKPIQAERLLIIDGQKIRVTYDRYISKGKVVECLVLPFGRGLHDTYIFVCGMLSVRVTAGRSMSKGKDLDDYSRIKAFDYLNQVRSALGV